MALRSVRRRVAGLAVFFLASFAALRPASTQSNLSEFDYLLLGLSVRPDPEFQVVPKNVATGLRVAMTFSNPSVDAAGLLALLPAGIEVAGELIGPGLNGTVALRGPAGDLLPIPPLPNKGAYLVRDLRLEQNGQPYLRASPDAATIEVIDRVLITQVTTRPLTLDEIRERGIILGDDDFSGFEFTLALKLDSRPVEIKLPVLFDSRDVPIPSRLSRGLFAEGETFGALGTVVPILMRPAPPSSDREPARLPADVRIPGLIVIPGDIGFLNQFFSAILIVSNGAPSGSGLEVSGLAARIALPPGNDGAPGTSDDPLEIADTQIGGRTTELPIRGLGLDGAPGTGDDFDRFEPGEQGQAEFLLEGRREGFHQFAFDIEGTLEGLPVGPVPITGTARGGVLVRNPYFNLTFSAPATVRKGEEFSLYLTVNNVSQAIANAITVALDSAAVAGATPLGATTQQVATLLPGDSDALRFRFRSNQTGQVSTTYLRFDQAQGGQNTGTLRFHLGVGERGVPLSPDTLVMPSSVEAVPHDAQGNPTLLDEAMRVLGQAWSVANAPPGTLPASVTRVSRGAVIDHATELAEAGFRIRLGEPIADALMGWAQGWVSTPHLGFDQILRRTNAGQDFLAALGAALAEPGAVDDFHRAKAHAFSSLPAHILFGLGNGGGAALVDWQIADGSGRVLEGPRTREIPNAAYLPWSGAGRGLALLTRLGSNLYTWSFSAEGGGILDLSLSLPRPDATTGFFSWPPVSVAAGNTGRIEIDLLRSATTLALKLDRNGDGVFEETVNSGVVQVLASTGPRLLAATAIGPETLSDADPWGRVVALLFDRELRATEASNKVNYRLETNQVLSATLQPSERVVFLFLRDPVHRFIPRTLTASHLFDTRGKPMTPTALAIGSRLVDPGAIVSGRVLQADGTPVGNAEVLYVNSIPGDVMGISKKTVDSDGRYQFDYVRQSPNGPFFVQATDPETGGFQQLSTTVRVDGEHLVVDLVLLGRGGVRGTVRNLSSQPVPGARVLAVSQLDPASTALGTTDGNGFYQLSGLVVGPVTVNAVQGTATGLAAGNIQRAGTFAAVDVTLNAGAGSVSGRVFEEIADVLIPLGGARVYYLSLPIDPQFGTIPLVAATTTSAADGLYSFTDVPSGTFQALAQDLVVGRQASQAGTLVAGQAITDFDIIFRTTDVGIIQGRVLLAGGGGAAGAEVQGAGRLVVADAAGNFTIADVPIGRHNLSARLPGTRRSANATVQVAFPGESVSVTLVLSGAGRVQVAVLNPTGQPVANQPVLFVQDSGPEAAVFGACGGQPLTTDASGIALFGEVPVPGGRFVAVNALQDVASGTVLVRSDGETVALTLRFAGFGAVTGTVLDPDGREVLGADVVLGARRYDSQNCALVHDARARQVSTPLNGRFTFQNVPIGMITVSVSSFFFPVATAVSDVLLAQGEARDYTLTLQSYLAGELSGKVFMPDGTTPAGPGVSVTVSAGSRPDVTVQTDADGRYRFARIFPPGPFYILTAADPATGGVARETIALLQGQDLTANLRLLGRGAVQVTVLDGAGNPTSEAFVELARATFPFDRAAGAIDAFDNGAIGFERITEGAFGVTANDRLGRGGRAEGMVPVGGGDVAVTVSLGITGTVRGTFVSPNGTVPITNAQVVLRQGTGRILGSTTSSSTPGSLGRFEFNFVPAGNVLVTATDPLTGRIGEASGKIETEGQILDLEVRQLGAGRVSGRVTSGGNPVAGASVEIVSSTGLGTNLSNLKAKATTGAQGEFAFEGVPVGNFTLRATVAGLFLTGSVSGSIETDGQDVSGIEIALTPSGTVAGDVFEPDGSTPVPGAMLTLRPPVGFLRQNASASGRFRFEFVPAGPFSMIATENGGFDAGFVTGTLNEIDELEIDVIFNGLGTVAGTAYESDGVTLLTTGRVRLTRGEPFPRDETVSVSPDGTFTFRVVPVGSYNLSLSVAGSPLRGTAAGRIGAHGETSNVTIRLADAGVAFGRVVRPDGTTPAPNAVVTVTAGSALPAELTAASGSFRVDGIPLGNFTLRAQDPVSGGLVVAGGAINANGQEIDFGTLVLDVAPIAVESVTPAAGSAGVPPDTAVVVRFTDPTTSAELPGRFSVSANGISVAGTTTLSPDGLEVTFTAAPALSPRTLIEIRVGKDLKDTFGRPLGTDFVSTFHTGDAVLVGTVTSGTGGVAGAQVTLIAAAGSRTTTTDATGRYRFTEAPVGSVTVQANDPASGLGGSVVRTVGANDGLVVADISLAFLGNIGGLVTGFDGSPAGAGLTVTVLQGFAPVGLGQTDGGGAYLVNGVPLGTYSVEASNPVNSDLGRRDDVVLGQVGVTVAADVQLLGVGSVRVFVRDPSGAVVPGAEASLSFTRFGRSFSVATPVAEPDGSLLFVNVLAGIVTASGRDPSTGRQHQSPATAVPGAEVTVDVVLQPTGTLGGTVFAPDGATPVAGATVRLYRESGNVLKAEQATAAGGTYRFDDVSVGDNPHRIDVLAGGRLRARARTVQVAADVETTVNLTLVGLGTVSGEVLPPAGHLLSTSVTVTLESLAPDLGGILTDNQAGDGAYSIAGVPVGSFRVTARDVVNGFLGEASGAVGADGESVTADIQLVNNAINFGAGVFRLDANENRHIIQRSGANGDGTDQHFLASDPGGLHLDITVGPSTRRFSGADVGSQEESGRELVTAAEDIDGIRVRRKVFVPTEGYFARYLEVFENVSGAPLAFSASVVSNLNNSNGTPQVADSSDGNASGEASDVWLVIDDGQDADPFVSGVFSIPATGWVLTGGGTALAPGNVSFESGVGSGDGRLTVRYDLTLDTGERALLMHFASQQLSRVAARAAAERLVALPSEAIAGLSLDEATGIRNFAVPPDGVSGLAPLPALAGRVTGQVFAHDGTTGVGLSTGFGNLSVDFQSSHVLFRRVRTATADSVGNFQFQSAFTFNGAVAIPISPFTVSSSRNQGGLSVSAWAGRSFPAGATTATADLVFSGSAAIDITIVREGGAGQASSLVLRIGTLNAIVSTDAAGRLFYAPVAPAASPVNVTATASVGHSFLTISDVVFLSADVTTPLMLTFPATSTVSGQVRFSSGAAVPNRSVTIFPASGPGFSRSTDSLGNYALSDIPSGNYELRVVESGRTVVVPITVNAPAPVQQDIILPAVGSIALTALIETAPSAPQLPAAFASVTLTDSLGTRSFATNASGQVTMTSVAQGAFTASVRHPQNAASTTTASGSIDFQGQIVGLTVTLPAFGTVSGTVRLGGGAAAVSSQVEIAGAGITSQAPRFTSGTGAYSFTNVEALRPLSVTARHPAAGRSHIFATIANVQIGGQGQTLTADVTLPPAGTVQVSVTQAGTGSGFAGASISILDSFSSTFRAEGTTNTAGNRTITVVPEGSFTVRAEEGGAVIGEATGNITADGETVGVSIVRALEATVEGTVRGGDGVTPVAGAPVELRSPDGTTLLRSTTADSEGRYASRPLSIPVSRRGCARPSPPIPRSRSRPTSPPPPRERSSSRIWPSRSRSCAAAFASPTARPPSRAPRSSSGGKGASSCG